MYIIICFIITGKSSAALPASFFRLELVPISRFFILFFIQSIEKENPKVQQIYYIILYYIYRESVLCCGLFIFASGINLNFINRFPAHIHINIGFPHYNFMASHRSLYYIHASVIFHYITYFKVYMSRRGGILPIKFEFFSLYYFDYR